MNIKYFIFTFNQVIISCSTLSILQRESKALLVASKKSGLETSVQVLGEPSNVYGHISRPPCNIN